ncbi:UNVERIFIED_ORG: ubiquinone/menaquinone biosynthesis C-methylase UbiE [Burkholderia contaminans]|nr:ubiquinone/menaquinone biosynthesis C-methylase UbiE [Burkholderia contaminans]
MIRIPPYGAVSRVYDHWTASFNHRRVADMVEAIFGGDLERANIVDVCCGTGVLAAMLANRGANVLGVDASEEMLTIARRRFADEGLESPPTLMCSDAARLTLPEASFDGAVCTLDSFNYFPEPARRSLCLAIKTALKPGGMFVFDMNTEHKLRDQFGDTTYAEAHEGYAYIWKNSLQGESISFDIELFCKTKADGVYERFHERHVQYIMSCESIQAILHDVGFEAVDVFDDYSFTPASSSTLRATFFARG